MKSSEKKLVRTLFGEKTDKVPFWFMRQAGRYLPEYRDIRKTQKNFLDFCYTPTLASKVTIQPIERFGMDGAIIFSDILVIPDALGVPVRFEEGIGPILTPVRNQQALDSFTPHTIKNKLAPVYEALSLTRKNLPEETALIGFAGAPWTLASYTVEGRSSKDFAQFKTLAAKDEAFFSRLISLYTDAVIEHTINQIEAGAEIIQLFDSWAGLADVSEYEKWIIAPTKKIVHSIKEKHPEIPVIGFPRQSGIKFERYAKETGVNALNVDQSVPIDWIKNTLQPICVVQGLLNNQLLADNKTAMLEEANTILTALDKPFVFNLAHGILPHTPIENMQALCDLIKSS